MDTTAIGVAAATLMENVAEEFGEDATIEAAIVVADVTHGEGDGYTAVRYCARTGDGEPLSCAHSAGMASIALRQLVTPTDDGD